MLGFVALAIYLPDEDFPLIPVSYRRFLRCAAYGGTIALDYKWSLRGMREEDPDYPHHLSLVHRRSAERLLRLFETNRGIFVKAGQHMAALSYVLPPEYVDTMRVLHDRAPTMDPDSLDRAFLNEFRRTPEQIFDKFDPTPLAAASLAQVHRAVLNGQEVAVKVQFPQLQELCAGDIRSIDFLLSGVCWMFPEFKLGWLVEEFQRNLPLELDFLNEARNSERVSRNFAARSADLKTPQINWEYTTERVITMEYIDGVKANDYEGLVKMGLDVAQVAALIADLFSIQVFEHGFVHCDPHPGNILVTKRPDGNPQVVLLDHGLYKELPDSFRLDYCRLWRAIINQDVSEIEEISRKLGVSNFRLFASMLTARAWETVTGSGLRSQLDSKEKKILREAAAVYAAEITQILDVVPQQLLLLLKLNDNLRSINVDLGSPVDTLSISLHHCLRVLDAHESQTATTFYQQLLLYKDQLILRTKLWVYDTLQWFLRVFF